MIRAVAQGRQPLPEDPVLRAAVQRLARRFKVKKGGTDADPMEPAATMEELLHQRADPDARATEPSIRRGNCWRRFRRTRSMMIVIALPPGLRSQLMAAASPVMRRKLLLANAPQQMIAYDLSEGKLYRAILSNRQLEEELVDFWYNHFNVFLDKGADRFDVPTYEREAIRPHVLGHFRELLEATATSPAMLFYLDNWQSVAPEIRSGERQENGRTRGLNENYARELMELHTLGVDGGYTQKDVTEVARCFTGWTIRNPQQGGAFTYNDRVHDKGEKIVLGVTIPAGGGKDDGEKVLDILAQHPSTARFISRKLAQRFVADDPPPALIDSMAKTFARDQRRHSRSDEDHAHVEGIFLRGRVSCQSENAVRDDRQRGSRHGRTSRLRFPAGESDRAVRRAAVSQAGADRLFERQCGMGEFGVFAGAHEFRDGADAE